MTDSPDDQLKQRLEDALKMTRDKEGASNVLALLFPRAEKVLQTYVPSETDDAKINRLRRRLSQRDFAANYFTLSPTHNSWGRLEFENLLKNGPKVTFDTLKNRLQMASTKDRSSLLRVFLELLDSAFSSQLLITQGWLDSIIAESPTFLREKDPTAETFFAIDNGDRLRWLVIDSLSRLSEKDRAALLRNAISSAQDLTILSDVVRSVVGDVNPEGSKERREKAGLGDEANDIRDLLIERVRKLAESNEIWGQADAGRILWFWWGADKADEVLRFTDETMKTIRGLEGLFNAAINTVISSEGNYEHVNRSWSKIANIQALVERAQELLLSSDNEEQKQLANRFLAAVERGREGHF